MHLPGVEFHVGSDKPNGAGFKSHMAVLDAWEWHPLQQGLVLIRDSETCMTAGSTGIARWQR